MWITSTPCGPPQRVPPLQGGCRHDDVGEMQAIAGADALQQARMLLGARRYQDAATIAYQCAGTRPGDPQPLIVCAWAEMGLGRLDAAERAARSAVGFAPNLTEAQRVLAAVLTNRAYAGPHVTGRKGRNAVNAARDLVRVAPDDASSYRILTDASVAARRYREAIRASNHALELGPEVPGTWLVRARAARIAYDFQVAEACAREALRLDPDHYLANTELGVIFRLQGRRAEAMQQLADSASLDPVARPARAHMIRYGAGPFLLLTLLLTSPIVFLPPHLPTIWILGSVLLDAALWRIEPTKGFLERRATAIAMWQSRRAGSRRTRRRRLVPPTTPIQAYRSRRAVPVLSLLFLLLTSAVVIGATAQHAPAFLPLTLPLVIVTGALGWFVIKRIKPRPLVSP